MSKVEHTLTVNIAAEDPEPANTLALVRDAYFEANPHVHSVLSTPQLSVPQIVGALAKSPPAVKVETKKLKDVTKDAKVTKAFGGQPGDGVVTVTVEKTPKVDFLYGATTLANAPTTASPGKARVILPDDPNIEYVRAGDNEDIAEAKVNAAVASALAKTQLQGTFMVGGVLQDPIKTGIGLWNGRLGEIDITGSPPGATLPQYLDKSVFGKTFSLYLYKDHESEVYYYLDADSTVSIGGGDPKTGYYRHRTTKNGVLVLINSSSTDDIVIGESVLANTDSSYSVLNQSTIAKTKNPADPWELVPVEGKDGNDHVVKTRLAIRECEFKRCLMLDSTFPSGRYIETHLTQSSVDSSGYTHVLNTTLQKSTVRGSRVTLEGNRIYDSNIHSDGEVTIKNCVFKATHVRGKSLFIPNKFNYLELDTPLHKLYLVRSSPKEFDVGFTSHGMERFRLNDGDRQLERFIFRMANVDPEGSPQRSTIISDSISQYMLDSIRSRLTVINTLDAAEQLVLDTNLYQRPWDDIYSL